jgi:anti-anti-sigma regulatory factor
MKKTATITIPLPRALRIETAAALMEQLQACLSGKQGGAIALDAGAVEVVGSAGVQLLLGFHKGAADAGRVVTLVNHSDNFRESWAMLGLAEALSALTSPSQPNKGGI